MLRQHVTENEWEWVTARGRRDREGLYMPCFYKVHHSHDACWTFRCPTYLHVIQKCMQQVPRTVRQAGLSEILLLSAEQFLANVCSLVTSRAASSPLPLRDSQGSLPPLWDWKTYSHLSYHLSERILNFHLVTLVSTCFRCHFFLSTLPHLPSSQG